MWEKVIINSSIQNCYIQFEEIMHPEFKNIPMVIGSHAQSRHGVVLAVNEKAEEKGIKVGESLRSAYCKCSHLTVIDAHYDEYFNYMQKVKKIYLEYTDNIEVLKTNDVFIDLTSTQLLFGENPVETAKEIQNRILNELGIVVSMGVSFNKTFAKMANRLNFIHHFNVISKKKFKDCIMPLSIDYLFDNKDVCCQLKINGILTIEDLMRSEKATLHTFLGNVDECVSFILDELFMLDLSLKSHKNDNRSYRHWEFAFTKKLQLHFISFMEARMINLKKHLCLLTHGWMKFTD